MPGRNGMLSLVTLAVAALLTHIGCERKPQPAAPTLAPTNDPDYIILHLKNHRFDGQQIPLAPTAEQYVDRVLTAEAPVRESLNPILRVRDGEYLWDPEAEEWFDLNAIQSRIDRLDRILADDAQSRRAAALQELHTAIQDIPTGILDEDDSPRVFIDAVWSALKWQGGDLRYIEAELMPVVAKHKLLYARALKQAATLAARTDQPTTSTAPADQIANLYSEVRLAVLAAEEAQSAYAQEQAEEARQLISDLEDERAALLAELEQREATEPELRQLTWIEALLDHQRTRAAHFQPD